MNYTIIANPYKDEKTVVATRGVMTDAKVAKLNNEKKKPALVRNWEELRPQEPIPVVNEPVVKDYSSLLDSVGIKVVNPVVNATNSGAKKLRVNKIVNEKARNVFENSPKIDVVPEPVTEEIKEENALEPTVIDTNEDTRGRHEKTGEIPLNEIKEALINDTPVTNKEPAFASRIERNATMETKTETKPEAKAGDMDLYNNLLHSVSQTDDVSRQLQGARNQLSIEKEESRKLAEQYGEAVKELEKLKEDIEVTKKQKEQKVKEELSMTLKSIENLQKENLERTSDLTSIQSEIARLKAEKQAMEANDFE